MFGRRKKKIPPLQRRCRANIIQETLTLIAVANQAERESLQSGDAESTDAQELSRTKVVLEAQTMLTERIVLSQSSELTMTEISTELMGFCRLSLHRTCSRPTDGLRATW